jgi:hypothetical protein
LGIEAGTHYVWLIDLDGNKVRVAINITSEAKDPPTPEPTATQGPLVSATATDSPTLAPSITPTASASATATVTETALPPIEASPVAP